MESANAVSFFAEFKRKYVGSTLLNSFNELIDYIAYGDVDIDELRSFAKAVGAEELIFTIYNKHLKAYDAKELALSNNYDKLSIDRETFIGLYNELSEETKKFVAFLFASPKLIYEIYSEKCDKAVLNTNFPLFLATVIKDDGVETEALFGSFSVIDCVMNASVSSSLLTDITSLAVDNSELFWSKLEMVLAYGKTTGKNKVTSFQQAISVMERLAPTWNQLKISSQTMNEEEMDEATATAPADIDSVVAAFRGDYSVVPATYPAAKSITTGLVSNFVGFNRLSNSRKLQVCNFLMNNRAKFNEILQDSCKIVSDSIARDVDRMNYINYSKFGVRDISRVGYKSSKNSITKRSLASIKSSFSKVRDSTPMAKANYIIACFIPLVSKFKSEVMNAYGRDSQRVFENINNELQIFGDSLNNAQDMLSGGEPEELKEEPVVAPPAPEPIIVEKKVYVKQADDSFDQIYSNYLFGGDAIIPVTQGPVVTPEQMIAEIEQAQIAFNKGYEEIYRQIIKDLDAVRFEHVYHDTINKLYPLCRVFNDVMIKKSMTTVYLSGLYGKKNRNNAYRVVVDETVATLKKSGIPSFGAVIATLERLSKFLIDAAEKAKVIHQKFVRSPRTTSALLIEASRRVKIPCKLTANDFNAFEEAIARLINQVRNSSSQSSVLNDRAELNKYLEKASSRAGIIKSQYESKKATVQYMAATIAHPQMRTTYINYMNMYYDQMLKLSLYINNVVETYLTKQRMQEINMKQLTKEEIKHIENAFLLFRKRRVSKLYKEEFKRLNKLITDNRNIYNITNQMAVVLNAGRYVDFIAAVYRELHIMPNDFNWEEFNRNIINYIVLSSVQLEDSLKLPDVSNAFAKDVAGIHESSGVDWRGIHNWGDALAAAIATAIKKDDNKDDQVAGIYSAISKSIQDILSVRVGGCETSIDNDLPKAVFQTTIAVNGAVVIDNVYNANGNIELISSADAAAQAFAGNNERRYFLHDLIIKNIARGNNAGIRAPGVGADYIIAAAANVHNIAAPAAGVGRYWSVISRLHDDVLQAIFGGGVLAPEPSYEINKNKMDFFNIKYENITTNKNDALIIDSVFDSLILNIVTVIDKYWTLKYKGNLALPMNIPMMIKGGSVFDTEEFHDITNAEIIAEAVPFYITGLNVCAYYINNMSKKSADTQQGVKRRLKISKISVLYPIAEIFEKYKATVETLSMNQLTTCIGIFNDIWNQTQGANEAKLSASIDMLLNELNASMFLGDEISNSVIENGMGSLSEFVRSQVDNLSGVLEAIKDVYKNAAVNSYNIASPEEEQIAFEKLMRDCYQKIKALPQEQRMTELRSLLSKREDDDINMHEYYKFMDLVIAPLIVCTESYNNVFKMFEVFVSTQGDGKTKKDSMDLTKYKIEKMKVNMAWVTAHDGAAGAPAAGRPTLGWDENDCLKADNIISLMSAAPVNVKDHAGGAINLNNADIGVADAATPRFIANGNPINFWDFVNQRKIEDSDIRIYLENNPIVQKWNVFQFNKMIEKYLRTSRLEAPDFWYVWDRNSWPVQPTCEYTIEGKQATSGALPYLASVFNGLNAKTAADYFEYAIKEFANDLDQTIHLFMSYPGISDQTIRALENDIHNRISADKLMEDDKYKKMSELLRTIKIEKSRNYQYPTEVPTSLPLFNDAQVVIDAIDVTEKNDGNIKSQAGVFSIETTTASTASSYGDYGSGLILSDKSKDKQAALVDTNSEFRYGWIDWAIATIAKAHPQRQIPYKLAQLLISDSVLGRVCKPMMSIPGKKPSYIASYVQDNSGKKVYLSPITQNILSRSIVESNKAITDYSMFGQNTINDIVAIMPYVISQIQSASSMMDTTAMNCDMRGVEECGAAVSIFSRFYNEISTAISPISFLQKTTSTYDKDHIFGEIVDLIYRKIDSEKIDLQLRNFSQLEWANKYKFTNLSTITFPDFKNKDKFEFIHGFASNVFSHPIFNANFKVIIENMGKQLWNAIIANLCNNTTNVPYVKSETMKLIQTILLKFMETGYTDKAALNYIFEQLFNGNKIDSDNVMERMTGGRLDDDFKASVNRIAEAFKDSGNDINVLMSMNIESKESKNIGRDSDANIINAIEKGVYIGRGIEENKIKSKSDDLIIVSKIDDLASMQIGSSKLYEEHKDVAATAAGAIAIGAAQGQRFGQPTVAAAPNNIATAAGVPSANFADGLFNEIVHLVNFTDSSNSAAGANARCDSGSIVSAGTADRYALATDVRVANAHLSDVIDNLNHLSADRLNEMKPVLEGIFAVSLFGIAGGLATAGHYNQGGTVGGHAVANNIWGDSGLNTDISGVQAVPGYQDYEVFKQLHAIKTGAAAPAIATEGALAKKIREEFLKINMPDHFKSYIQSLKLDADHFGAVNAVTAINDAVNCIQDYFNQHKEYNGATDALVAKASLLLEAMITGGALGTLRIEDIAVDGDLNLDNGAGMASHVVFPCAVWGSAAAAGNPVSDPLQEIKTMFNRAVELAKEYRTATNGADVTAAGAAAAALRHEYKPFSILFESIKNLYEMTKISRGRVGNNISKWVKDMYERSSTIMEWIEGREAVEGIQPGVAEKIEYNENAVNALDQTLTITAKAPEADAENYQLSNWTINMRKLLAEHDEALSKLKDLSGTFAADEIRLYKAARGSTFDNIDRNKQKNGDNEWNAISSDPNVNAGVVGNAGALARAKTAISTHQEKAFEGLRNMLLSLPDASLGLFDLADTIWLTPFKSPEIYASVTHYLDVVKRIEAELIDSLPKAETFEEAVDSAANIDAKKNAKTNVWEDAEAEKQAKDHGVVLGYGYNYQNDRSNSHYPNLLLHPNWERQNYIGTTWESVQANKSDKTCLEAIRVKGLADQIIKNEKSFVESVLNSLNTFNYKIADAATLACIKYNNRSATDVVNAYYWNHDVNQNTALKYHIVDRVAEGDKEHGTDGVNNNDYIPASIGALNLFAAAHPVPIYKYKNTVPSGYNINYIEDYKADIKRSLSINSKSVITGFDGVSNHAPNNTNANSGAQRLVASANITYQSMQAGGGGLANYDTAAPAQAADYLGTGHLIHTIPTCYGFNILTFNPDLVGGHDHQLSAMAYTGGHTNYTVAGVNQINHGAWHAHSTANNKERLDTNDAGNHLVVGDNRDVIVYARDTTGKAVNGVYANTRLSPLICTFLINLNIESETPADFIKKIKDFKVNKLTGGIGGLLPGLMNPRDVLKAIDSAIIDMTLKDPFRTYSEYLKMKQRGISVQRRIKVLNGIGVGVAKNFLDMMNKYVYSKLGKNGPDMTCTDETGVPTIKVRGDISNTDPKAYVSNYQTFDLCRMNCAFDPNGKMIISGIHDTTNGIYYGEAGALVNRATINQAPLADGRWYYGAPAQTKNRWEYVCAWLFHKNDEQLQNVRDSAYGKLYKAYRSLMYTLLKERLECAVAVANRITDVAGNVAAGLAGPIAINGGDAAQDVYNAIHPAAPAPAPTADAIENAIAGGLNGFAGGNPAIANSRSLACFYRTIAGGNKYTMTLFTIVAAAAVGLRSQNYSRTSTYDILVNLFKSQEASLIALNSFVLPNDFIIYSHAIRNNLFKDQFVAEGIAVIDNSDIFHMAIASSRLAHDPAANVPADLQADGLLNVAALANIIRYATLGARTMSVPDGAVYDAAAAVPAGVDARNPNIVGVAGPVAGNRIHAEVDGKLSTDNIKFFDIIDFFTQLLGKNLNKFIDVNIDEADNWGFLIPKLTGGDLSDNYNVDAMMQSDGMGTSALKTMKKMYANKRIPYQIFAHLFNGGIFLRPNAADGIFKSAMNYFHKHDIGMASIFNTLCYAQILTSRVQLNTVVGKLSEIAKALPERNNRKESNYSLVKAYIANSMSGDEPFWNDSNIKNITFISSENRKEHFDVPDFVSNVNKDRIDKYMRDMLSAPSINNSFMRALIDNTEDENLCAEKKVLYSLTLFNTSTFRHIRRLDQECTYINMLIMLLRMTSYYDSNEEVDTGFFGDNDDDIFDSM